MAHVVHIEELEGLVEQYNLGREIMRDLKGAAMQHRIHLLHGDGLESGEDESCGGDERS